MRRTYNQKNNSLTISGVTIQDFFEGASFVVTLDGGEVEKTQGTDGASVNIATNQGITIEFTLRETSRSMNFLTALRKTQENGGPGVPFVFRSGADVLYAASNAFISRPGQLSTGDKKQAGMQFTLTAADDMISGLDIS